MRVLNHITSIKRAQSEMADDKTKPTGTFLQTIKVVFWAFLGVRKQSGYDEDIQKVPASHAIIIGIVAVILFIATLITVVNIVLS